MKKSLIALAVLAASGASFAQSSLTLYGIADVYFGSVRASGMPTQTVIGSGGVSASRFGFKGMEDLGGGAKANFVLEQGFDIDNGTTTAGQAFSRQSYVGFSSRFGESRLGRTLTPFDDINAMAYDAFDSKLSSVNNVWASTSSNYNPNPRNTAYYGSPSFGGFSGAISGSLGENKTAAIEPGGTVSFNLKYEGGPLYAGLGFQREKFDGTTPSVEFTRVNATYDFGMAKLLAGFGRVSNKTMAGVVTSGAEINEWQIGVDFPVSKALTVSGGFARSSDNVAAGDATRKGYSLAALYLLSKRTAMYGGYQSATQTLAGTDTDASLFAVGLKHSF